jgi:hypothetical protein
MVLTPETPTTKIPELLSPREAAAKVHTTAGCLAAWRCNRSHALKFVRIGRKIYYRVEDIAEFINSRIDPGTGPKPARFIRKPANSAPPRNRDRVRKAARA